MIIYTRKPRWKRRAKKFSRTLSAQERGVLIRQTRRANFITVNNEAHKRASELRLKQTPSELKTASLLQTLQVKFIPQAVHYYDKLKYRIVDFYLPYYKLNIEIDGGYHDQKHVKSYDIMKDFFTKFRTLRFKNEDVFKDSFLEDLKATLIKREIDLYRSSKGFKAGEVGTR